MAVASVLAIFSRTRDWPVSLRFLACSLPIAVLATLSLFLQAVLRSFSSCWSGIRIAPALALANGFDLYSGPSSGPILGTVYGPVKALLLLPAAWLTNSPTSLIAASSCTLLMVTLGSMFLGLMRSNMRDPRRRVLAFASFMAVCFVTANIKGLQMSALHIHADAPAVGLGLLSCLLIVGEQPRRRRMWASALLAVLAAWSKQVEVVLAPAQLLFIWVRWGPRESWRHCIRLALFAAVVSTAFFAAFGFKELLFNTVTVVGHHPLIVGDGMVWHTIFSALTQGHLLALVVLAAALLGSRPEVVTGRREIIGHLVRQTWFLPALAAATLFPISILGRLKVGGDDNAFHFLFYLVAASALAAIALGSDRGSRISRQFTAWGLAAVLLIFSVLELHQLPRTVGTLRAVAHGADINSVLFRVIKGRPGEIYFPWLPLPSLMATGEIHHSEYGVWDRELASSAISGEHARAHVPKGMKFIAYEYDYMGSLHRYYEGRAPVYEASRFYMVRRYFAEFSTQVQLAELPGWIVFARRPAAEIRASRTNLNAEGLDSSHSRSD